VIEEYKKYFAGSNVSLTADFNFSRDPEAAHIALASGHNLITLVPKELCRAHGLSYVTLFFFLNCSKLKNKVFA